LRLYHLEQIARIPQATRSSKRLYAKMAIWPSWVLRCIRRAYRQYDSEGSRKNSATFFNFAIVRQVVGGRTTAKGGQELFIPPTSKNVANWQTRDCHTRFRCGRTFRNPDCRTMPKVLALWPGCHLSAASLCNHGICVFNHTGPRWPCMALYLALLPPASGASHNGYEMKPRKVKRGNTVYAMQARTNTANPMHDGGVTLAVLCRDLCPALDLHGPTF